MCVYRADYDSSVEIQQKQIVSKQKLIYSWGIGYKKKKKKKNDGLDLCDEARNGAVT